MTDYFALLGQPRRPWLDAAQIQQSFIQAASGVHPDRLHEAGAAARREAEARYTELNAAWQCLSKPHTRLRHLLELERGRKVPDLQEMDAGLARLFSRVGEDCRRADRFLAERGAMTSPLLRVALFERGEALREALEGARREVQESEAKLEARLRTADREWMQTDAGTRPASLLGEMESLFRLFSFHERWAGQLQQRWLQLVA